METARRHRDAVLWPFAGTDAANEELRGDPVEIKVRVVEKKERTSEDDKWSTTLVMDREVALRSVVVLGTLADFYGTGTGSGSGDVEALVVEKIKVAEDVKGRNKRWKAQCGRRMFSIPPAPRVGTPSNSNLTVAGAGFGFAEISTGTGTGTDDVACSTCTRLNEERTAALTENGPDAQAWETEPFEVCGELWVWALARDLAANVLTARLEDAEGNAEAEYRMSGVAWNGTDEVTLNLQSGSALCEWALLLTVRGA